MYDSGRHARSTKSIDGKEAFMKIESFKTWLVNKGISHWGSQVDIHKVEVHDARAGAMLFGQASIVDGVINARSSNPEGALLGENFVGRFGMKYGFQVFLFSFICEKIFNNNLHNFLNFDSSMILLFARFCLALISVVSMKRRSKAIVARTLQRCVP